MAASFHESLAEFRRFLKDQYRPQMVVWVTQSDVLTSPKRKIYVRVPVPQSNENTVRELFNAPIGVRRGIAFQAICHSRDSTFAYAWKATDTSEENGKLMDNDLKLSVPTGVNNVPGIPVKSELRWKYLQRKFRGREKLNASLFGVGSLEARVVGGSSDANQAKDILEFAPDDEIKKIPELVKDLFEHVLYDEDPNFWLSDEATIWEASMAVPDDLLLRVRKYYGKPVTIADLKQPLWKLLPQLNEGRNKLR